MKLKMVKKAVVRTACKVGTKFKKHSPEILTTVGIVSMLSGMVFACRGTLKAHEVIEDHKARLADVHDAKNMVSDGTVSIDEYTDKDYRKDLVTAYVKTGVDFLKLYGPALIFVSAGIISILSGHHVLRKRNAALAAAYTAVDTAFKEYRDRVRKELGNDADYRFRTGAEKVKLVDVTENEDGTTTKKTIEGLSVDSSKTMPSMYARFFDEGNPYWVNDAGLNLLFLKNRQCEANERLILKGHLTLNEVYDMLGMDETPEGAVVGWILKGDGDGFVDFGIFDVRNKGARHFVNREEKSILLDFNVDGVMWNKI